VPEEVTEEANWEQSKSRMNQNISNLLAISKTYSTLLDEVTINTKNNKQQQQKQPELQKQQKQQQQQQRDLSENSSTQEFKNYLEGLKQNYLAKLTMSCPSKLMTNAIPVSAATAAVRRSLHFDVDDNDEDEVVDQMPTATTTTTAAAAAATGISSTLSLNYKRNNNNNINNAENENEIISDKMPELSKPQIMARLIQIREYLKQAYSMLSTLQSTSSAASSSSSTNDLTQSALQTNKLYSLIDHLKDQEKGYLDLLNSLSEFQYLADSLISVESSNRCSKASPVES
jgi:hypothetical protein